MTGEIEWGALAPAGAFVLGAVFATIAMLRIFQIVARMFDSELPRGRRKRREQDDSQES